MGRRHHWTRVRELERGPRSVLTSYMTLDKSFNFLGPNVFIYNMVVQYLSMLALLGC